MKTRKIAVVSDAVMPFHKGGKEMRIHQLTRRLTKLGFQVDIYTMKWWDGDSTYVEDGVTFHALCRLYPLYAGSRRSIPQAIMFGLSCLKMVRYDYDILEVDHMPVFPLFFAKIASKIRRRQLYATWHEVWGKDYWQEYLGNSKGFLAYLLERASVMMPNHILAVSEQTEQQLRAVLHYSGPSTLIRNAVDTKQIFAVQPTDNSVDILYVGRLLPHKNVDMLIKAIALIISDFPTLQCEIIGGGPEKKALESLVRKHHLGNHVRFRGVVPSNDDVIGQMKATKVFVSPSSREGAGITVLEAMACGSRVVTTNFPDNAARFLVKDAQGTVCEPTVDDLATALRKELKRTRNKKFAKIIAEQYDWDISAKRLGEAYAS